jgi:hypothetical protein
MMQEIRTRNSGLRLVVGLGASEARIAVLDAVPGEEVWAGTIHVGQGRAQRIADAPEPAGPGQGGSAPADSPLRVWVPACATGEEAYSIGMQFLDAIDVQKKHVSVQILATDVDQEALAVGRLCNYPRSTAGHVPANYLDGHPDVQKHVLRMLHFVLEPDGFLFSVRWSRRGCTAI